MPINAYLRRLLAIGKDGGQNLLLQKIETGLDIDATIVRNRVVAAVEAIEIERSKWIAIEKSQKYRGQTRCPCKEADSNTTEEKAWLTDRKQNQSHLCTVTEFSQKMERIQCPWQEVDSDETRQHLM